MLPPWVPDFPCLSLTMPSMCVLIFPLVWDSKSQESWLYFPFPVEGQPTWALFLWMQPCKVTVTQSWTTLCDPIGYSLPGSSVHGILQARILEWVAIHFSRGSSWPRIEPRSLSLQADSSLSELPGKPQKNCIDDLINECKHFYSISTHAFLLFKKIHISLLDYESLTTFETH